MEAIFITILYGGFMFFWGRRSGINLVLSYDTKEEFRRNEVD